MRRAFVMNDLKTGMIFDIERCSMYDGPGIRTTVFLKGCPLSCKWCHNPESQKPLPELAFYAEKCVRCGNCAEVCSDVHKLSARTHKVLYQNCKSCSKCTKVCPVSALKLIGKTYQIKEVMDILRKDIPYFEAAGGGLTVSGGEPFSQYIFLKELLQYANAESIHTCIETSGFTTREKIDGILPYTDLFLFDYKVTSPELHRQFTGVDNHIILENFRYLYSCGQAIILRCPIIPGYNDTEDHFRAICDMEKQYPNLSGIEIMPYHSLGRDKAAAVNKAYEVAAPAADDIVKNAWKGRLMALGASKELLNSF